MITVIIVFGEPDIFKWLSDQRKLSIIRNQYRFNKVQHLYVTLASKSLILIAEINDSDSHI